jgi:SAM-dependent methyltransferase
VVLSARDLVYRTSDARFTLTRCDGCGLCYFSPRPGRDAIGAYYPSAYGPHSAHDGDESRMVKRRSKRFDPVGDLRPGRYLDVGCGAGQSLLRMKSKGWDVVGFDVSEQAAAAGRRLGVEIRTGRELGEAGLEAASFDLVTLFCVLPHVHDPAAALREVARVLRPGGLLLMTLPNLRSLNFALFRAFWYHLEPPRHLFFFSERNLEELAARTGFEAVGRRCRTGGAGFKHSLRLLGRASGGGEMLSGLLQWRPCRWLLRVFQRYVVDMAGLGDTVDCWWRRR